MAGRSHSFKAKLGVILRGYVTEVRALTPFTMVEFVGFGKVAGYAPEYLALKEEVDAFFSVIDAAVSVSERTAITGGPAIVPNRLMNEGFFLRERDRILRSLETVAARIASASEAEVADLAQRLHTGARVWLDELAEESASSAAAHGADAIAADEPVEPRGRLTLTKALALGGGPAPVSPAAPGSEPDVYVGAPYAPDLGAQLSDVVARRGLRPVASAPLEAGARLDIPGEEARMQRCAGAFVSLVDGGGRAVEAGLTTLDRAERRLPGSVLVVAQEKLLEALPKAIAPERVFAIKHPVMDEYETSLLGVLAERTSWLKGRSLH